MLLGKTNTICWKNFVEVWSLFKELRQLICHISADEKRAGKTREILLSPSQLFSNLNFCTRITIQTISRNKNLVFNLYFHFIFMVSCPPIQYCKTDSKFFKIFDIVILIKQTWIGRKELTSRNFEKIRLEYLQIIEYIIRSTGLLSQYRKGHVSQMCFAVCTCIPQSHAKLSIRPHL